MNAAKVADQLPGPVGSFVRRNLVDKVPRDHRDTTRALRRRQVVVVAVILVGAGVLAVSLNLEPGDPKFYAATLVLAALWTVGAFLSGRLHLGRIMRNERARRPVVEPIVVGVAFSALFVIGGLVVRQVPFLDREVAAVLAHANEGVNPVLVFVTVVNGIAEELFFRGAVYAASTRRPVTVTSVAYFVVTLAAGNVMLAFAAILLGVLVGLQRRASGGILAPILTHVVWSTSMLFILPLLFGNG